MRSLVFLVGLFVLGCGTGRRAPTSLVTDVTVTDNPALVLQKNVAVTLSEAASIAVACTRDSDSAETHLVESIQPATSHSVQFHGLAADESYACTVGTPEQHAQPTSFGFTTGSLPSDLPTFWAEPSAGSSMVGTYTLVPHQRTCENSLAINGREAYPRTGRRR